jgi:signal transduction histidine kinase
MGTNVEPTARHKDGTEIPVKIGLSPINTGGETLVMAYIVDITAEKQLEASLRTALAKEMELNELKTSFTSIVSHEFRTPLSVILSSTELLTTYGERMDQNRRQEKLENIIRQVKRLIQLLDDVLMITRSESAGFAYKPVTLDLVALCEELLEEIRAGYRQDVTIEFTPLGDCRACEADEFLFSHILQNLASNAMKYSRSGGVVRVELTCTPAELKLQVQDQGIGIPQPDQSRLFEAFRRAANVGQIKGTGIGLTIVKRAVDACGGTIAFTSAEGEGTTFTVTLPTPRPEAKAVAEQESL